MNYYAAPMEGLTDRIWRQVHQKWFGAADAPTRYYAPFLSPPENRVLIPKKMAELAPEANAGTVVIPQLLARDGELAAWMIGEVRKLGYTEVNLNFGCPSGTVTAKGKGAGMLRDPARLDAFLDAVFSAVEGPVSVKTRLGKTTAEGFPALLELYNDYPICELIVHPRVQADQYHGHPDLDMFAYALAHSRAPVCYNGDLRTVGEVRALEGRFPEVTHVMIGRGLVADPALARKLRGGKGTDREELTDFLAALYQGYTDFYQGQVPTAAQRMREVWFYLIHLFDDAEKLNKQLRRFRTPAEYERIQAEILASCPIRSNVQGDLI